MNKRNFIEFSEVHQNFECKLLVPIGMPLQGAFECTIAIMQNLGNLIDQQQAEIEKKKEEKILEEKENDGKNEVNKVDLG